MEVAKEVKAQLLNFITEFNGNKTLELECKYKDKLTKDMFTRALQYYRSVGLIEEIHDDVLDIFSSHENTSYRTSVRTKENIQKYCISNNISSNDVDSMMVKKTLPGHNSIMVDDYSFKVDLRSEVLTPQPKLDEVLLSLAAAKKGYRYKKRFSYTTKDGVCRFDFTVVKQSKNDNKLGFLSHNNMVQSGLVSSPETYEIEIEIVKRKSDATKTAVIILQNMIEAYAVINGVTRVVSKQEMNDTVLSYVSLWYDGKYTKKIGDIVAKPNNYFIGPQPVTLEKKNIIEPGVGRTSIQEDYTVTDKADGQRYLLYVNNTGKCYMLSNRLEVVFTGVTINTVRSSIFDGEYITRDANGDKTCIYAIFDAYFYNGEDVRGLPLVDAFDSSSKKSKKQASSRLSIMQRFSEKFKDKFSKEDITLMTKTFLYGGDIFEHSKTILDQFESSPLYKIDGLIYTPMKYPVGGSFVSDKPNTGTWDKVLKWKPPHENTIDFLVKLERDEHGKVKYTTRDGKMFKVFRLHVGYSPSKWEPFTARDYFTKNFGNKNKLYVAKEFTPPDVFEQGISNYYGILDDSNDTRCMNGEIIEDSSVVEFAFDLSANKQPYPFRWKPLRLRKDKVHGNDFGVAINIWRSINEPVTKELIVGEEEITSKDIPQDSGKVYYNRNISRDKFASRNMMNFHNFWIKKQSLISKMKGSKSLFDIACGKGGDLQKWLDIDLETVVGIDYMKDNIENPVDGAYARLAQRDNFNPKYKYVFLTMDGSKRLDKEYFESLPDKHDGDIAKEIWGFKKSNAPYAGLASKQFDVVSCQFAIHYFFGSEQDLDTLVMNVDSNLKDGGYFIGTCLDGFEVKKLLKDCKYGQSVSGRIDDRYLWDIQKVYRSKAVDDVKFGEQVKIYMESIGVVSNEYLVNISTLVNKLKAYGIHVHMIKSFKEVYTTIMSENQDKFPEDIPTYYVDALKNMTPEEKQYSFLNILFMFKKDTSSMSSSEAPPKTTKKIVKKKPLS